MGIFSGIGGNLAAAFSGASFEDSMNTFREFIRQSGISLEGFREKGQSIFDVAFPRAEAGPTFRPDVEILRTQLLSTTAEGLSPSVLRSFKQSQRLLNENLVGTGNLRSSAAGILGAELGEAAIAQQGLLDINVLQLLGEMDIGQLHCRFKLLIGAVLLCGFNILLHAKQVDRAC